MKNWELVIIGAGPAGMSAAIEAHNHGLSVLVLDRQPEPGGQIFRSAGVASQEKKDRLGKDYARGSTLIQEFLQTGVEFLPGANVWFLEPGRVCYSYQGKSYAISARQILIATGGMERPVPLPGWELPGVMGAGAADVLLKSASLLPQGPVILCGNGPLILQTAVHLRHCRIPVAGVLLTGNPSNSLRASAKLLGALLRPMYMANGLAMGLQMVVKNRCYPGASDVSITKDGSTFTVDFSWIGKKKRRLKGSSVLLHEGVISETRITRLARLRHTWDASQRYWHVETNQWGATNLDGMYCAGDTARVRGADAAMAFGRIAALDICRQLGRLVMAERDAQARPHLNTLRRCNAMQPFLDKVFAPNPSFLQPAENAIVCRCEELTAKELHTAIQQGCYSLDGLKAQARPGMGTCQGRMCASAAAEMIAQTNAIPLERIDPYHAQPPLFPLSLAELASMNFPEGGL